MRSKTARVNLKDQTILLSKSTLWVYWRFSIWRKYKRKRKHWPHTILRIQIEGFLLWTIMVYWKRRKWGKLVHLEGLPRWLSSKESDCQCRSSKRKKFNPWVRKTPWNRKWQPTLVFLPEKSHAQRSLTGYSPKGWEELDMTDCLSTHLTKVSTLFNIELIRTFCKELTSIQVLVKLFRCNSYMS